MRDLFSASDAATPERRNALARLIVKTIEIEDDRVVAVAPRRDFAPFIALSEGNAKGWLDEATPDCQGSTLAGGSDGDRLREIDVGHPPLVPLLYSQWCLTTRQRSGIGRYTSGTKESRILRETWPDIAALAKRSGLRAAAREYGVSHEWVRTIVRTVLNQE